MIDLDKADYDKKEEIRQELISDYNDAQFYETMKALDGDELIELAYGSKDEFIAANEDVLKKAWQEWD